MKHLPLIAITISVLVAGCNSEPEDPNEFILKAHTQYLKSKTSKWVRSTYLPDSPNGVTKGDEYQYCIDQGWYKSLSGKVEGLRDYDDFDSVDFCGWHAEIGKWNNYDVYSQCYAELTALHKANGLHDRNREYSIRIKQETCGNKSRLSRG